MLHLTRRLLTAPLLVAAIGAAFAAAPATAAHAATVSGTVTVNTYLMVRSEPSLAAQAAGQVRKGQKVTLQCVTPGTSVRGTVRTSNLWAKIGTGKFLPYAYLATKAHPTRCATGPQAAPVKTKPAGTAEKFTLATVRSADGKVNVRSGPSTTAKVIGQFVNGTKVNLVCGVTGDYVNGTVRSTNAWDRLSNGYYISHAYLITDPIKLCAGSSQPTTSTPMTPEAFIKAAVPGAQQGWRQFGVPPSVTIAQAILESGWGKSGLSSVDKNYFGIKCFNNKYGTIANGCHAYTTQECTKAGKCFTTTATFRTYATMAHSFRDHGSFLKVNSRYAGAFQYTKSANKFIWTVWKAGYATDPNYYTKVTGIMAAHKLYQYDTWK